MKAHPWYNGPVASLEEIQQEFALRKERIDKDNEQKRIAKEQEKAQRANGGLAAQRRVYRKVGVNRGHGDDNEENKYDLDVQRQLDEYCNPVKTVTEFFTTENPDVVFDELLGYF